ncbi:MAG: hypothetical protein GY822_24575 [Deltaproteobacteria bacterium]|nr:hypothetical protein [Deltaproteobacteria bacterium]
MPKVRRQHPEKVTSLEGGGNPNVGNIHFVDNTGISGELCTHFAEEVVDAHRSLAADGVASAPSVREVAVPVATQIDQRIITRSGGTSERFVCEHPGRSVVFTDDVPATNNAIGFRVNYATVRLEFLVIYDLGGALIGNVFQGELAHHYPFDVDLNDKIGSAHGEVVSAVTTFPAFSEGSVLFDGLPGSYVDLPNGLLSSF